MAVRVPHLDLEAAMGKASQASIRVVLTTKEEFTLVRSGVEEVCMFGAAFLLRCPADLPAAVPYLQHLSFDAQIWLSNSWCLNQEGIQQMDMTILPPQEAMGMPARTGMLHMGSRRNLCMARMLLPHLTRYGCSEPPAGSSDYGTDWAGNWLV